MPGHHHRSGPLRQSNKRNKRTKSSKRNLSRLAGGKIESRKGAFKQRIGAQTKADRRHIQQQKREAKRQEIISRRRGLDGAPSPPRVVGIVSLGEDEAIEDSLRSLILQQADHVYKTQGDEADATVTAKYNAHKKDGNLTVLTNSSAFKPQYSDINSTDAAVMGALDLCRVCDMILFVLDADAQADVGDFVGMNVGGDDKSTATGKTNATGPDFDHLISERGDRVLSAVKGQGIPRVATILAKTEAEAELDDDHMTTQSSKSLRRANIKRRGDLKRFASRFATTEFGVDNDKVIEINLKDGGLEASMDEDGTADPEAHSKRILASALVRTLCTMSAAASKWVSTVPRAYVLSDKQTYDPSNQELQLTGYVRGPVPFEVNSLVHIPNVGTFACKSIKKEVQPSARKNDQMASSEIIEADPMKRENLELFATPHALDGEQNLIGFDEAEEDFDEDGEKDADGNDDGFARPAGWSDYQSSWLDAVDQGDGEDIDYGELAKELNAKSSASVAPGDTDMDLDDANRISETERQSLLEQRQKQQQEHQEFPDEVQVNEDDKARDRFARYRSLKSFKKSHWDPKENLPDSYSSIYNFSSFKATQREVMADMNYLVKAAQSCDGQFWGKEPPKVKPGDDDDVQMDDSEEDEDALEGCVPSNSYVTLTLEGVASKDYEAVGHSALLVGVTLLPHENKMSVLHMGLSQGTNCNASDDVPVKSKDMLTFRCGWRTWTGLPIFSQNNLNCDKHKFERFLPQNGAFFAGSVFGPVTYTPCPVLVFRDVNGQRELVATGSMIGADSDRVVVKRIVLTGYPVRVHKRFATVKYMFYDPEDVKWFKPAGITTKHGLNGKIEESVGEHGTMKCLFNAPIKQHDTVCLPLYKRVFPKFVEKEKATEGGTVRSNWQNRTLVVK